MFILVYTCMCSALRAVPPFIPSLVLSNCILLSISHSADHVDWDVHRDLLQSDS